jgi:predicted nuclease with TOPRIM domain
MEVFNLSESAGESLIEQTSKLQEKVNSLEQRINRLKMEDFLPEEIQKLLGEEFLTTKKENEDLQNSVDKAQRKMQVRDLNKVFYSQGVEDKNPTEASQKKESKNNTGFIQKMKSFRDSVKSKFLKFVGYSEKNDYQD